MTYTAPTPADLKARYPAFSDVPDATVTYWLTDAKREADDSWGIATDIAPAQIAVAVHNMMAAGVAGLAQSQVAGLLSQGVTSFRSGSFSAAISEDAVKTALAGGYEATAPGREYLRLLARNKAGGMTTGGGTVACNAGYNGFAGPLGYPAVLWPL